MKRQVIIAGFILISLVALFLLINVSAPFIFAVTIDPSNTEDPLGIGVNPADIPTTPDELTEASSSYLQKRWENIITNSRFAGIHNSFLAHPLPFTILFHQPYSFSLTFFLVVIFWIFLLVSIGNLVGAYSGSGMMGFAGGLVSAILLSWIGVIGGIATFVVDFILGRQSIWIKILLWIAVFVILAIIFVANGIWKKSVEDSKKQEEKRRLKEKVEEHEEFVKGVEEGRRLTEPLRKFKKQTSDIN
ncbi:MAG: hypothetical protein AABX17_00230 [Nanoarchaeota archaeon]